MNRIIASITVATALLAATTVPGLAQRSTPIPPPPQAPAANQTTQAPYTPAYPDQGPGGSTPLFNIGKLPVVVWAPVEPSYNSKGNGTMAANWPWAGDAY